MSSSNVSQHHHDLKKTLIVLMDTHDENGYAKAPQHRSALTTILLPDLTSPDKTCSKIYWVDPNHCNNIYELYGIENETNDEYASFLVNGIVVPNGVLHTLTIVDPLWFVVRLMSPDNDDDVASWKPLDQLLCDICEDTTTRDYLTGQDVSKYSTIMQSMELSEDEIVYKLSKKHVLSWLSRKQQAVEAVLRLQAQERTTTTDNRATSSGFAVGFVPGRQQQAEESMDGADNAILATSTMPINDTTIRDESIQVVCQYLSHAWRDCFLKHLEVSRQDVLEMKTTRSQVKKIKPTLDWNAGLTESTATTTSSTSSITPKEGTKSEMTAGAKQLQKVNTKGMSKLSSFFATKPKKK